MAVHGCERCDGSSVWLSPAREALPKVAPVTRWRWGPLRASRALIPLLTLTATAALAKLGAPITATVALAGHHWLVAAREVADLRGALAAARAGFGSRLANLGAFVAARALRRVLVSCGPREWFHDGLRVRGTAPLHDYRRMQELWLLQCEACKTRKS